MTPAEAAALLAVPDDKINAALYEVVESVVKTWGGPKHDRFPVWKHLDGSGTMLDHEPPVYCSEESPRSLLYDIENRCHPSSYWVTLSTLWSESIVFADAASRARAALWCLAQDKARGLIGGEK